MREGERQRRRPEGFFLSSDDDCRYRETKLASASLSFLLCSLQYPSPASIKTADRRAKGGGGGERKYKERERALSSPPPRERERMRCCGTTRFPVSLPSCLGSASLPETFLFYRRGLFQSIGSSREKREEEKKKVERRNEGHVRCLVDFSRQRPKRKNE